MSKQSKQVLLALINMFFTASTTVAFSLEGITVKMPGCEILHQDPYEMKIAYLEKNSHAQNVILLIHGNSASKEFFENFMDQKELDSFRLIAVDLPGHGQSDPFPSSIEDAIINNGDLLFKSPQNFYTFSGYANVLNIFLKILKISSENVSLFGWSLGGHIAIEMVEKEPNLNLAILSGSPIASFKDMADGFEPLKQMLLPAPFEGYSVFELLGFNKHFSSEQAIFFHSLGGIRNAQLSEKAGMATHPSARHYVVKFALGTSQYIDLFTEERDPLEVVTKYSQKFRIIQGDKDPLKISGDKKEALEARGLLLHEIEECGHAVFLDAPEKLAKIIISLVLGE